MSTMTEDALTREVTERAKQEVARDFATWLRSADHYADVHTRTMMCYVTERALAQIVARTTLALGDYVARGALIEFAAGLSDYIERDMFQGEVLIALKQREATR